MISVTFQLTEICKQVPQMFGQFLNEALEKNTASVAV